MKTDCLIIGYNDSDFEEHVRRVKAVGVDSENLREMSLSFFEHDGRAYHAMGVLNRFYNEGRTESRRTFFHAEFLWACITTIGTHLWRNGLSFAYVNLFQRERDRLRSLLASEDVLTVAVTTTLYVSPEPVLEVIRFVRTHNSTAKIVVGGPYIQNQSKILDAGSLEFLFKHLAADYYIVSQEGEATLAELIRALKQGRPLTEVPNLAYFDSEGRMVRTESRVEDNPLSENMVNYTLFSPEDLGRFISLRTAKSCPFKCAFCGHPEMAGQYRYLDVAEVERELEGLAAFGGVHALDFVDDTFNVPKPRFKELMRMMIRRRFGFRWISYLRADHADAEVIELMGEAGCAGVFLGIESGSERILKAMNKTSRTRDYLRAIPQLQRAGILVHANLIVGFPGETFETVEETIDFIEEAQPDFYRAQLWYCDPATPVWRQREQHGIKGAAYKWAHNTMDSQTAADLREHMYLRVKGPIWLPDHSFEVFCVLYLQQMGMRVEQVKGFLTAFNRVVRDRLLAKGQWDVRPELMAALRQSAQYDDNSTAIVGAAFDMYTGERYDRAREHFFEHFRSRDAVADTVLLPGRERDARRSSNWVERPVTLTGEAVRVDVATILAASTLLGDLRDRGDFVLVVKREATTTSITPVRLDAELQGPFDQYRLALARRIDEAAQHALYAPFLLRNRALMLRDGVPRPRIRMALVEQQAGADPYWSADLVRLGEITGCELSMACVVARTEPSQVTRVALWCGEDLAGVVSADAASSALSDVLERVASDGRANIGELLGHLEASSLELANEFEADASAAFEF